MPLIGLSTVSYIAEDAFWRNENYDAILWTLAFLSLASLVPVFRTFGVRSWTTIVAIAVYIIGQSKFLLGSIVIAIWKTNGFAP